MLEERTYAPSDDEILYHYCGSESFHSICTSKNLRFSDVFAMNDFMEIHWGYSLWEKAAAEVLSEVGEEFIDRIDEVIHEAGFKGLPLVACFSKNGDVLSQWRAYADDGYGYALGFRAKDLIQLPVRALTVEYSEQVQKDEIKSLIRALHRGEQKAEEKYGEDFARQCQVLAFDLAAFKNPAFREEEEVRFSHVAQFWPSNDSLKLVDPGGLSFGIDTLSKPIQFRMKRHIPVAFLDIDFTNEGKVNPIVEVIMGPKNAGIPAGINIYLETIGIGGVKISKSAASYR